MSENKKIMAGGRIHQEAWRKLKAEAALQGRPAGDLLEEAIWFYLDNLKDEPRAQSRSDKVNKR